MNPTDTDIRQLYAKFCEERESSTEDEAFFLALRSMFPQIEGAEDETRTWVRYSPKLTEEICRRIAVGEPIRWILRDKQMPNWNSLRRWMDKYPEFGEKYARAMEHRADYIAHKMVELAKKCEDDPKSATAYKVAASILQWQAAMGNPRKYSDRLINVEEREPPKDLAQVVAEFDRLCKELGVPAQIFLEHKPS